MAQLTATTIEQKFESLDIVDAHCHLNLFENPLAEVEAANASGVRTIITCGGSNKDNLQIIELTLMKNVFGAIGIDPTFAQSDFEHIAGLADVIKKNPKIVAIGEIGLDYKHAEDEESKELQKKAFAKQIEIAMSLNMPIVVHARNAMRDTLDMLRDSGITRVMMHYFDGSVEEAEEAEAMGYFVSIPPLKSKKRKRIAKVLTVGKLLCETDAPVAGKHISDVCDSIQLIADAKGIGFEEVAMQTAKNARSLFLV